MPDQYRGEFDRIIDFMNQGASQDGSQLRREIARLDQRRDQNLADTEPELAELIHYDRPQ